MQQKNWIGSIVVFLFTFAAAAMASADEDFLPIEEAYRVQAYAEGDRIVLVWTMEPGYYVYRKRFAFESATPQVKLQTPAFPAGEAHEDEAMGKTEIYRQTIEIPMGYTVTGARPQEIELKLKWQGCADAGLCYPPTTWTTTVELPAG